MSSSVLKSTERVWALSTYLIGRHVEDLLSQEALVWIADLAEVLRLEKGWRWWAWSLHLGNPILAQLQLSRQVGDVADGEAQGLDLGQGLSGRGHGRRKVGSEMVKSFG